MISTTETVPEFHRLHIPGDPFLLPCAWDVASAQLFAEAGYRAIGTTSLGVAAGIGAADEDRESLSAMADLLTRLRTALPGRLLSCDFEDGYSDDPGIVVETLRKRFSTSGELLIEGINIEDSARGRQVGPEVLAEKIPPLKAAFPGLFVNARIDTYWVGQNNLGEVLHRIRVYADSGADGIFVPGDLDLATIESIVTASPLPVNVLASPRFSRTRLAEVGVARISTGSLLYRAALSAAARSLGGLNDDRPAETDGVLSYRAIGELSRDQSSS